MTRWRERIDELLYAGESVRETVGVNGARVAVTSHRVLAFTPEMDGPNFRSVDRPNVLGVDTGAQSEVGLLEHAVKVGVVGAVLIGAGRVLDFGSVVGDVDLSGGGAAEGVGLGGVMGTMAAVLAVLRNLDQYMQLVGALALLLAAVMVGVYWYLRDPTLVIEIDGAEDIHVPRPDEESDAVGRLERAISPGAPAPAQRRSQDQGTSGPD